MRFKTAFFAAQAGVSEGSVANVVGDLRAGRVLSATDPGDQLELLRELAVDLRRLKLTPGNCLAGVTAVACLHDLGLELADIGVWAAACRRLAGDESDARAFVQAALAIHTQAEKDVAEAIAAAEAQLARVAADVQSQAEDVVSQVTETTTEPVAA